MVEEIQRQRTVFPAEDTPTRGPWQPGRNWEDNKTTDWRYEGRDPEGNIQATWRTNRSGPEGWGGIPIEDFARGDYTQFWDENANFYGPPRQRTEIKSGPMGSDFFNEMYPTYDDQIMRGQGVRDYQNRLGTAWSDPPLSGWESKSPGPYYPAGGTQWGGPSHTSPLPPEGEFGGLISPINSYSGAPGGISEFGEEEIIEGDDGSWDIWDFIQRFFPGGVGAKGIGTLMGNR
jgi:hypothetical protein